MGELDKLEAYLKEKGIEYVRKDVEDGSIMNTHQLYVIKDGLYDWDAICHYGSYGYEEGLLEIMGRLVDPEKDGDTVAGWLTADDVIERIEGRNDD